MVVIERVSEERYRRLALADGDRLWELRDGRMVEKPRMGTEHNHAAAMLFGLLFGQLDPAEYQLRSNSARLRHPSGSHLIPDVAVVPVALERRQLGKRGRLETYDAPLPLVVEIWSAATPDYDEAGKIALYRRRGDQEMWFLEPDQRHLTRWPRRPDGGYDEESQRGGIVRPAFLPNVVIDLDDLFADGTPPPATP